MPFQFTISLLWALTAASNAPSLMAWSRDAEFAARTASSLSRLDPDPSLVPAVALSASLAATWGDRAPRPRARGHDRLSMVLQACCILVVLYGSISLYRLNFILASAFVAVAIHQLLAGDLTEEELEERKKTLEKKETAMRKWHQMLIWFTTYVFLHLLQKRNPSQPLGWWRPKRPQKKKQQVFCQRVQRVERSELPTVTCSRSQR